MLDLALLNGRVETAQAGEARMVLTSIKCLRGECLAQAHALGGFHGPHAFYSSLAADLTRAVELWEARLKQLQPAVPAVRCLGTLTPEGATNGQQRDR